MKVALVLIFFVCIVRSMASNSPSHFVDQLTQQGQAVAQVILDQLQQQILSLVQQAVSQLSNLVGSGRGINININMNNFGSQIKPMLADAANQALSSVLSGLSGLLGGGRSSLDFGAVFNRFLQQIIQHLFNQDLAAALSGLGGSRGLGDIFTGLQQQITNAVTIAQSTLTGAFNNLAALGSSVVDASKPHWQQLQGQLVGHGLNVLGSISESVNNLHSAITSGR